MLALRLHALITNATDFRWSIVKAPTDSVLQEPKDDQPTGTATLSSGPYCWLPKMSPSPTLPDGRCR